MDVVIGNSLLRAEVFPAIDVSGREHLVIVAKGTWRLPKPGQRPKPIAAQPLVYSDQHYGEPGVSALRYPNDMVRFKPQCDILFDACAHMPDGKPDVALAVQAQVGACKKQIKVWGPRVWQKFLMAYEIGKPAPFTKMPLHDGLAFGGSRAYTAGKNPDQSPAEHIEAYDPNPVGVGWAGKHTLGQIKGQAMPCLEDFKDPIKQPDGRYKPVGLNAIAPNVPERSQHAGTYDEAWRQNVFPFLPEDFDERFHQSAPPDQRLPYPQGGEPVELIHLLPNQALLRFALPKLNQVQVRVLRHDYSLETPVVNADTVFFELEDGRFSVVWRASVVIRKHLDEFNTIAVGPVDEQWWTAKSLGLLAGKGCKGCDE